MDNARNGTLLRQEKTAGQVKFLSGQAMDTTALLETLPHGFAGGLEICSFDEGYPVLAVNDGFTEITGYTMLQLTCELSGKHEKLILPDDLSAARENLRWQIGEGQQYTVEYRMRRRDGYVVWVLDSGVVRPLKNGQSVLHRTLTDISRQKRTEEGLRSSNKRYEIGMEFSDVTIFDYDIRTRRMEHHWRDMVDYRTPRVIEDAVETMIETGVVQPESAEAFRALYRKIENGAPTAEAIIHALDAHGNENVLEIKLTSMFEEGSDIPMRAIGVKKDITKAMLLQRERDYASALTANRILTYEANVTKDKILSYNELWARELELEMEDFKAFSDVLARTTVCAVMPEDQEMFLKKSSAAAILAAFEQGQCLITFEYRRMCGDGMPHWYEKIINVVKDEITGDILIRCHITNIDDRKVRELRMLDERRNFEVMLSKSAIVYEIDITQNRFLSGLENWLHLFGFEPNNNYEEMLLMLADRVIHPADRGAFLSVMLRKNALRAFAAGKFELNCEYRRPDETCELVWMRCTMHLFEEPYTGNIKGFAYVEKIDEEKRKELALIYRAQHDSLSGFYNKMAVEEYIDDFLGTGAGRSGRHVFFIIDLDHFKLINDNFGHAFGDATLSQFAAKLRALFRDNDLLGRIGGDEFVVLMKNVADDNSAILKAHEICESMMETYTQNGESYRLSVSIGIAYYGDDGKTYDELYRNSDTALYYSKEHGRNCFSVYNSNMAAGAMTVREIDCEPGLETKEFKDNIIEYTFRILYETNDKKIAINAVLALVGKHFNVSRAYVFEDDPDGRHTSNTFEWCAPDIASCMGKLQHITYSPGYKERFNSSGVLYIADVDKEDTALRDILKWQRVRSLMQFTIRNREQIVGFVGFDQYQFSRVPSATELSDMRSVANVLGMFIREMRGMWEMRENK